MNCPECGYEIIDDTIFCNGCRVNLKHDNGYWIEDEISTE